MNSPSDTLPAGLRKARIIGLGGTIMSLPGGDTGSATGAVMPTRDATSYIMSSLDQRITNRFSDIDIQVMEPLIDSSQATARTLTAIVKMVRDQLQHSGRDDFLILSGTDSMADLMASLAYGIPAKYMEDKSVVVTCAMQHLGCETSDAMTNIRRSLKLFDDPHTIGRLGLMFGERFHSPFGIEKVQLGKDHPFAARFHRMAKFYPDEGKWLYRDDKQKWDSVRGNIRSSFKLVSGVEELPLTPTSSYESVPYLIRNNRGTVLVALGNGNLRTDRKSVEYLKQAAVQARGPVVVVGRAIYNSEDALPVSSLLDRYEGDSTFFNMFTSAGAMTVTETRIYLSSLLAEAEERKIREPRALHNFVQSSFSLHPFRTHQDSIPQEEAEFTSSSSPQEVV